MSVITRPWSTKLIDAVFGTAVLMRGFKEEVTVMIGGPTEVLESSPVINNTQHEFLAVPESGATISHAEL